MSFISLRLYKIAHLAPTVLSGAGELAWLQTQGMQQSVGDAP
jgi:hypothetical protein